MATKRFPIDWPLVIVALLLSIYGIAIVYSAGQTDIPTAVGRLWKTQLVWFGLALLGAYGASRCSVRLIDWLTWPAYFLSVGMLVLLLFIGKGAGTAASTKSWLAIGGFRIGQPSERRRLDGPLEVCDMLEAEFGIRIPDRASLLSRLKALQ